MFALLILVLPQYVEHLLECPVTQRFVFSLSSHFEL